MKAPVSVRIGRKLFFINVNLIEKERMKWFNFYFANVEEGGLPNYEAGHEWQLFRMI
jgi:hypothetical protein